MDGFPEWHQVTDLGNLAVLWSFGRFRRCRGWRDVPGIWEHFFGDDLSRSVSFSCGSSQGISCWPREVFCRRGKSRFRNCQSSTKTQVKIDYRSLSRCHPTWRTIFLWATAENPLDNWLWALTCHQWAEGTLKSGIVTKLYVVSYFARISAIPLSSPNCRGDNFSW